jgi:hypothetical protein
MANMALPQRLLLATVLEFPFYARMSELAEFEIVGRLQLA